MRNRLYIASIAEDAAALAGEYGIGLELDHYCTAVNMEVPNLISVHAQARRDIEAAGAPGLLFHAPFNELSPGAIDPEINAIAYKRYEQSYRLASEQYQINRMIVHSGYMPHVYYKIWHQERSVEFWNQYMENKPDTFQILIENVLEDEPYMMARLGEALQRTNIALCLDIGHANCISSIPVKEWIRVMGPFTEHVHIHNNYGDHDYHNALADGSMDMAAVLEDIERYCKKSATITIESLDGRNSLEWLDKEGYLT